MASIIKVDQLSEKTQGSGITLSHSLKNSSGSEIISSSGSIGSAVDFANIANDSISGDKIHSGTISSSTLDGIKLKSSGDSITKSDGTTAVLSESGGVVTLNNGTIGSGVTFPAGNCIAIHTTTSNNTQSTTSGDNYLTFGTVTTQKNNSKIVCAVSTKIYKVAGSIDVCIFQGTGITGQTYHYMKLEGNINSYSTGFFTGTMNSTTTLTIQARVLHDFYSGGSGTVTIGDVGHASGAECTFITVWEFMS